MAEQVSAAISVQDGASAPIDHITESTKRLAEQMERTAQIPIIQDETADRLIAAMDAMTRATTEMTELSRESQQTMRNIDGLNDSLSGLLSTIGGIAGMSGAFSWMQNMTGLAGIQNRAQVQLGTTMQNAGNTAAEYQGILQYASGIQGRTMYGDEAMISGAAELATYTSDNDAVKVLMDTLTDYAAGMSGGAEVDASGMVEYATQLGKAMGGVYDGLNEKGFVLSETQKEIIKNGTDMEKALVLSEVIEESWGGLAQQMASLPSGRITQAQNMLGDMGELIGNYLLPAFAAIADVALRNQDTIQTGAEIIGQGLQTILTILAYAADLAASFGGVIVNNWDVIGPIVTALAVAFGVLTAAMLAHKIATAAASAAQWLLNTAMLASPVTWIVIAIVAVVGAIYAVVAAINKVTGTTTSATGVICGAVMWLVALIVNIVVGSINAVIQLLWSLFVEPFIGIIEWILNACLGGFDSFGDAVANLIGNIISWFLSLGKVVTHIIDAIFGTNWTAGLSSLQETVLSWGKNDNYITLVDRNAPTIDYRMNYSDAYNAGYDFGAGIDSKLSEMFTFDAYGGYDYNEVSGMDELLDNTNSTADSANAIKNSLGVAEEDLKYLIDIAERDAINRFTTAELKISMTNHNQVSGTNDLDGIVTYLADETYRQLVEAAEGVHS